jgi:hypothetical protein
MRQLYSFTALQLYSFTALQLYSFTALQLYSFTALQLYSFTALQLYSFTALQIVHFVMLFFIQATNSNGRNSCTLHKRTCETFLKINGCLAFTCNVKGLHKFLIFGVDFTNVLRAAFTYVSCARSFFVITF